MANHVKRQ